MKAKRKLTSHEIHSIIGYSVASVILLAGIITMIVCRVNIVDLRCSREIDLDGGNTEEMAVNFRWIFGEVNRSDVKITLNTPEHITEEQKQEFKKSMEEKRIYKNIEYSDFFLYKITMTAEYDQSKLLKSLGSDDYDGVKNTFENQYSMTCH